MSENIAYFCNDKMIDFFITSQESRLQNLPKSRCHVIPFDDNSEKIYKYSKVFHYNVVDTDIEKWEALGELIYANMNQKPDVKKKSLFRKLRIFELEVGSFLYVDANAIFLADCSYLIRSFRKSGHDLCFFNNSLEGRNFSTDAIRSFLNDLNPQLKAGYNAGAILGRRDETLYDDSLVLAKLGDRLQRHLGSGAEQAFLNYLLGVTGRDACLIRDIIPNVPNTISSALRIRKRGDAYWFDEGPYPGGQVWLLKWNGSIFADTIPNFEIVSDYHRRAIERINDSGVDRL